MTLNIGRKHRFNFISLLLHSLASIAPSCLKAILDFPVSCVTADLCNNDWVTSVHFAAEGGNVENLELLAKAGADFSVTVEGKENSDRVKALFDKKRAEKQVKAAVSNEVSISPRQMKV